MFVFTEYIFFNYQCSNQAPGNSLGLPKANMVSEEWAQEGVWYREIHGMGVATDFSAQGSLPFIFLGSRDSEHLSAPAPYVSYLQSLKTSPSAPNAISSGGSKDCIAKAMQHISWMKSWRRQKSTSGGKEILGLTFMARITSWKAKDGINGLPTCDKKLRPPEDSRHQLWLMGAGEEHVN